MVTLHHRARFRSARMRLLIQTAHRRLQGVHIEYLDWHAFIHRYDRSFALFYVDPPYWGHEDDYGKRIFAREEFVRIVDILRGLNGRFLLSLNDRSEARELFKGFAIEAVETRYSANAKATRLAGELLISN